MRGSNGRSLVARVAVPVVVPRRVDERVHRVGLALRAGPPHPGQVVSTNSATSASGESPRPLNRSTRGSSTGRSASGTGRVPHVVAVDDRDRRPPVPLPGNAPVLQPELHGRRGRVPSLARPPAVILRASPRRSASPLIGARVDQHAVRRRRPRPAPRRDNGGSPGGCTTTRTGRSYLRAELEVPLIVGGHRHDRAGAVVGQHEVRDPDRDRLARERIAGPSVPCRSLPSRSGRWSAPCDPAPGSRSSRAPERRRVGARRAASFDRPAGARVPAARPWRRRSCRCAW